MDAFFSLMHGFEVLLTPANLGYMVVGILFGVLLGFLPGVGGANGIAILLPLTFSMPNTTAIIMLAAIYWGALFGGCISAILFNIPGEPWSVATTFDGHPLAKQGRAGEALTASLSSSFIGALIATIMLTFMAPIVANFALDFGPPEYFAVYLLTFCSFVGMGRQSPFKVISAMMLGFAFAAVGTDEITGGLRLTFGTETLLTGFHFLIAVIGLFGIGEILVTIEKGLQFEGRSAKINPFVVWQTWKKLPQYWVTIIRGTAVGIWLGVTPGGATPASFMSYGLAKRFSKNGHKFGTGELEGVVAPETAAHAAGTSALLPMLTLGIPGSPTAAVLLGGLLIWGLQPGPLLFVEQKDFVWGLIASIYLGNVVGLVVVLSTVPLWASDHAHPVLDHRAHHHRGLRHRVLHPVERAGRSHLHGDVRHHRLRVQEARLSAGADGAGDRARRARREFVPAGDDRLAGQLFGLLVKPPCRQHRRLGDHHAVLAADRVRAGTAEGAATRGDFVNAPRTRKKGGLGKAA